MDEEKFVALEKELNDHLAPEQTATNILANEAVAQLRRAFNRSDCKQIMVIPIVHGQPSFYKL